MRVAIKLCLLVGVLLLTGCAQSPEPTMIFKPVDLGKQHIRLIRAYRCQHYQLCDRDVTIKPQMIVLHWTGTETWQQAFAAYRSAALEGQTNSKKHAQLNHSVQFLVARDGRIYQLMPSNWMANHVVGLNNVAIGIQNVGGVDNQQDLTPAEEASDVFLIRMLKKQYPTIDYLIGHYEYACFRNSSLWQRQDQADLAPQKDPGALFMQGVRQKVSDLELKGCK